MRASVLRTGACRILSVPLSSCRLRFDFVARQDPNKQVVRVYSVPANTFESDDDDDDEEQDQFDDDKN